LSGATVGRGSEARVSAQPSRTRAFFLFSFLLLVKRLDFFFLFFARRRWSYRSCRRVYPLRAVPFA
jgi:hypothetical protein